MIHRSTAWIHKPRISTPSRVLPLHVFFHLFGSIPLSKHYSATNLKTSSTHARRCTHRNCSSSTPHCTHTEAYRIVIFKMALQLPRSAGAGSTQSISCTCIFRNCCLLVSIVSFSSYGTEQDQAGSRTEAKQHREARATDTKQREDERSRHPLDRWRTVRLTCVLRPCVCACACVVSSARLACRCARLCILACVRSCVYRCGSRVGSRGGCGLVSGTRRGERGGERNSGTEKRASEWGHDANTSVGVGVCV